jgi:hypothetical protein
MTIADMPVQLADDVLAGGVPQDERDVRLDTGAATLAAGGRRSVLLDGRILIVVAGALMSGGIVAILLGWLGASRSILVSEQVPYLISGGLLGLALATIGALTYFTHWLTVLVRDNRQQHQELVRLLREERSREHEELLEAIRELRPARRAPRGS